LTASFRATGVGLAQFVLLGGDMSEVTEELKARTMRFALDVCAMIRHLPFEEPGPTVKRQLAKASTGVAFNYRSSCRSRSHTEFTARISVVAEEADESYGWLEFIEASSLLASKELTRLVQESNELVAIFSASVGTARYKERNSNPKTPRSQSRNQSPDHQITRSPD
jgi:four helix bundle protein